jgi:hypothetical protein
MCHGKLHNVLLRGDREIGVCAATTEEPRFLCGPYGDVGMRRLSASQDNWSSKWVLRKSQADKNVSTEAEGVSNSHQATIGGGTAAWEDLYLL